MIVQGQVHVDRAVDAGQGIDSGHGIFCCAVAMNAVKVMKLFVQHFGSDVVNRSCTKDSSPPLFSAISGKAQETVEWLIDEAGADPMSRDAFGCTILHLAASVGHPHICQFLLSRGHVPVDVKDDRLCTPLHLVCAKLSTTGDGEEMKITLDDRIAVVRILIEAGADKNAQDYQGLTPVDLARGNDLDQLVDYLTREEREAAVSK